MADRNNQFVEGDLILPEGIVRISVGFNDEATEACFIGQNAKGKMWLLGYRRIPTAAPTKPGPAASTWNTAETPYLAAAGAEPALPAAWKGPVAIMRGESLTTSEAPIDGEA